MIGLKILIGDSSNGLGEEICRFLDVCPIETNTITFPNGEVSCEVKDSIRNADVFIVQSICNSKSKSPNDNFMELLVTIDALKRSSANSITAVIPHFGYARQDRQIIPRTPITSRLVADILQTAGVNRIITVDIHSTQSVGFFTVPVANLYAAKVLATYIKKDNLHKMVIVSPDVGGASRARYFAKRFSVDIALIDKRRGKNNKAEALHVVGNVDGMDCVIFDDMIDTAGTLVEATKALKKHGAKSVIAVATHGVFSDPASERIANCTDLDKVIVANTIELTGMPDKVEVVSISEMLAKAIRRSYEGGSVSSMHD